MPGPAATSTGVGADLDAEVTQVVAGQAVVAHKPNGSVDESRRQSAESQRDGGRRPFIQFDRRRAADLLFRPQDLSIANHGTLGIGGLDRHFDAALTGQTDRRDFRLDDQFTAGRQGFGG